MREGTERLREELAQTLTRDDDLRTPAWRAAVTNVPREVFVGDRFYTPADTAGRWEPITRASVAPQRWLTMVYANTTLVTQINGDDHPAPGPVTGAPTSSSTLPGLVVRMLEDLSVRDGDRVLEIGTGTGYSTALLCERLTDARVVSVEVDPQVGGRAARALHSAGHAPTLVIGDGLDGYPSGAPYDRLIATCSVRTVPRAWLDQVRPEGTILATLTGGLFGFGLARLTVSEHGTAEGRFLPGTVSFMPARAHAPQSIRHIPRWLTAVTEQEEGRPARFGPQVFDGWVERFVAQCVAPTAQRLRMADSEGRTIDYLVDLGSESVAALVTVDGGFTVYEAGPNRLWGAVEKAVDQWQGLGSPGLTEFGVHADTSGLTVTLGNGALTWHIEDWV
ncbi:hypothetical protein BJF83_01610 [Nocardiopsis sp. CNR-923]|uniref:ATP-grasp peptide maturase system methyltransferase n=1 Tax=Nocardiopsis sp. CNR-923 TaxID=1904965 RepID=UPI00095CCA7F|nr:ATP-grasp peptide maturase system methyltransferase [Nocardiopsis sp. CNR-923]OLT28187.1 hypothetical protein BJF83_01610 [Nocardiopsis sp. CNR-923]